MDSNPSTDSRLMFVVRHGERGDYAGTKEEKKIQISFDPHLTDLGKIQARKAGDKLVQLVKDYYKGSEAKAKESKYLIISSPFRRCIQTAYHISQALPKDSIYGEKIYLDNFLSEHLDKMYYDHDVLDELQVRVDRAEIDKHVSIKLQDGFPQPGEHSCIPEYSEGSKIDKRVRDGFEKLKPYFFNEINKDKNVILILVSHGYVVEIFLEIFHRVDWSKGIDYTCLSLYELNPKDGSGRVVVGQCHDQLAEADKEVKKVKK